MGSDGTGRRSPWDLFAERRVHIRSASESRYVVLPRSLQIGVTAACLAIIALLGVATYQAISRQIQLTAQQGTLEELTALAAQADQSARDLAMLRQRSAASASEIERLTLERDQAQAERVAAVTASREADARIATLEAGLDATTQERRKLATELAGIRASGPAPSAARSTEAQALMAEVTGLRAELDRVNREAGSLRRAAAQAQQALRDLQTGASLALPSQARIEPPADAPPAATPADAPPQAGTGGPGSPLRLAIAASPATDEVRRLQQDLAGAQATIAALSADLETVKGAGAGAGATTATDAAAALATLKDQLSAAHRRAGQLGATLAAQQSEPVGRDVPAPAERAPLPAPPAPR